MSFNLKNLRGSMVALVTPFRHGRVDEMTFVTLCDRQIQYGTSALIPCGTTGEAATLTHDEHMQVIKLAVQASAGRVPVIAGAGSNSTATTYSMVAEAQWLGADAALCIVPYYNRPSQEGIYRHFEAIQSTSTLPIIVYDVPSRTGVKMDAETIVALSQLPNIIGIKDASGDLARARYLSHAVHPDFLRLCGDDSLIGPHLTFGSQGCISVTANVAPALCSSLHQAWESGDCRIFDTIQAQLERINAALFVESNPIPVKWALEQMGLIAGGLRLPMTPLAQEHHATVLTALASVTEAEAMLENQMEDAAIFKEIAAAKNPVRHFA